MSPDRSELLIRGTALYAPMALMAATVLHRRPGRRRVAAALLGTAWNLSGLLAVNLSAAGAGWWSFRTGTVTVDGVPVDLWIGWALLWGALPVLVTTGRRLVLVGLGLVGLDLVLMPLADPVVALHGRWLAGEALAVAGCLAPGLVLGHWTATARCLPGRVTLQLVMFTGLLYFVLPTVVFELTGGTWAAMVDRPGWLLAPALAVASPAAALALLAVREFARYGGTPLPLDPPTELVTTGPYAHVANPMQLGAAALLAVWGAWLGSPALVAAAVMAVAFSAGMAAHYEQAELDRRFGEPWRAYRRRVRPWLPRRRAAQAPE